MTPPKKPPKPKPKPRAKPRGKPAPKVTPEGVRLEEYSLTPQGGAAKRCQRIKRNGLQCGSPARRGFEVCTRHGAGLPSREEAGERKPSGRPPIHGLYSRTGRRGIAEIVTDLELANVDLDNTDDELRLLRGTLSYLLRQGPTHEGAMDDVRLVYERIADLLASDEPLDPAEAAAIGRAMGNAEALLKRTESWCVVVIDGARHTVNAVKMRAETRAKMAEARALDTLGKFVQTIRHILWDVLDEEQVDAVEERLMREVFVPAGMSMPDRDEEGLVA